MQVKSTTKEILQTFVPYVRCWNYTIYHPICNKKYQVFLVRMCQMLQL